MPAFFTFTSLNFNPPLQFDFIVFCDRILRLRIPVSILSVTLAFCLFRVFLYFEIILLCDFVHVSVFVF